MAGILVWMTGSLGSGQVPDTLRHALYAPKSLPQEYEKQGFCVAIDGNLAVIGNPMFDAGEDMGADTGVVKVFECDTGKLVRVLKNQMGEPFDYFGHAVAISGTRVAVAEESTVGGFPHAGRVHVFDMAAPEPTVPVLSLDNPDPAAYDQFGNSVALDGDTLVVGEWRDDSGATNAGKVHVYDLSSTTPGVPLISLADPLPAEDDNFGASVAVSGTRVVVAAYRDDTGAPDAGSAYVYELDSSTPGQPAVVLSIPGAADNDHFGNALAISGTIVAVGIEAADTGALNAGRVAVFDLLEASPGSPMLILENPDPREGENFGTTVSLSGELLVVGEYRDASVVTGGGACHVYDLAGPNPSLPLMTLTKPTPEEGDFFGNSVSISGSEILVGAWYDDAEADDAGASYFFDLSSPTPGVPVSVLGNPLRKSADHFGAAVAISGDLVAIGSPDSNTGASGAGLVRVFDLGSTSPKTEVALLQDPVPAIDDRFGSAVAVSGSVIVVGDAGEDDEAPDAGTIHIFDMASPTPEVAILTIANPEPAIGDGFGTSVAVSGSRIVVGVPADDEGAVDAGRVFVFDLSGANPEVPLLTIDNPSPATGDGFGGAVSIAGDWVVVGSAMDDESGLNSGQVYIYDLSGAAPGVVAHSLQNPTPATDDRFGVSVAIWGDLVAVGADGDDAAAVDGGAVHLFDLSSATPELPFRTLHHPQPVAGDQFGGAVAVSGARVAVGAKFADNGGADSGRGYCFNLSSPTPGVPTATIGKASPSAGDHFGASIAAAGVIVVVGTPMDDKTEIDKGAAYVFGPAAPEIAVKGPLEAVLANGGSSHFGAVGIGAGGGGTSEFTILNTGITGLTIQQISLEGEDAGDFSIDLAGMDMTVAADKDTTFSVHLSPLASGPRSAVLRIESSDEDENPFEIHLTGQALSQSEDTDGDGLNDVSELRMAALGFDWEVPNPSLVQTFQTSLNSAGFFAPGQVQSLRIPAPTISRIPESGHLKLSWFLEKDAGAGFVPLPMSEPETSVNNDGELEFLFGVEDDAAFFRLETE
ncbi:choice-of-anchor D domain-containing protein [Luteolibacter marinus]|uniref:choice-of-anchor D domain-containing protein n=1 Tax=Luteolibacter marinus TaxID=2776705 RepID=UPI001D01ED10|nr:choice-of-anchor D domain-containing protein [Luteolibacter marinus]